MEGENPSHIVNKSLCNMYPTLSDIAINLAEANFVLDRAAN